MSNDGVKFIDGSQNDRLYILTFDVEDWFHILDHESVASPDKWNKFEYRLEANMEKILDILSYYSQSATFFCLGWVAEKFPQVIRKLDQAGYEVATHSHNHQLLYKQTREDFKEDLKRSIYSLEDITGKKVRAYRAPGFSLKASNRWAIEVIQDMGIEIDCSVFPAKRAHGGFQSYGERYPSMIKTNKGLIKEFPMNVESVMNKEMVFSGGGYFRLYPYSVINGFMKKSKYVMTYLHPHDFDCGHPVIGDLPLLRKMKNKIGKASALKKLESLIYDFNFVDLATADKMIDWERVKVVELPERREKLRYE